MAMMMRLYYDRNSSMKSADKGSNPTSPLPGRQSRLCGQTGSPTPSRPGDSSRYARLGLMGARGFCVGRMTSVHYEEQRGHSLSPLSLRSCHRICCHLSGMHLGRRRSCPLILEEARAIQEREGMSRMAEELYKSLGRMLVLWSKPFRPQSPSLPLRLQRRQKPPIRRRKWQRRKPWRPSCVHRATCSRGLQSLRGTTPISCPASLLPRVSTL